MARIAGVNIPTNKRVVIALQYIHGIGSTFAKQIVEKVGIPLDRRVNQLTDAEVLAIRETIEETGVPVGLAPLPTPETLEALRAALHKGVAFGAALAAAGARLDLAQLVPFARWCPRHRHMRIFDTRFFLARLPDGAPAPRVDDTENVRVLWASAQDVLDQADAGAARIIFPTRRNLERLALLHSFADAASHAAAHPQRTITPWHEERDDGANLCIPEGLGYPVTSEPLGSAMRG